MPSEYKQWMSLESMGEADYLQLVEGEKARSYSGLKWRNTYHFSIPLSQKTSYQGKQNASILYPVLWSFHQIQWSYCMWEIPFTFLIISECIFFLNYLLFAPLCKEQMQMYTFWKPRALENREEGMEGRACFWCQLII